jgi:hypothetical protein
MGELPVAVIGAEPPCTSPAPAGADGLPTPRRAGRRRSVLQAAQLRDGRDIRRQAHRGTRQRPLGADRDQRASPDRPGEARSAPGPARRSKPGLSM